MNTNTKCHITAQFVLGMLRHSKDTPHLINKKENNQSASYQTQFLTDNTKNKVAEVLGRNAACLLTISDSLVTGEEVDADTRATAFVEMVELALEAAIAV